jgi:hypothetical protein
VAPLFLFDTYGTNPLVGVSPEPPLNCALRILSCRGVLPTDCRTAPFPQEAAEINCRVSNDNGRSARNKLQFCSKPCDSLAFPCHWEADSTASRWAAQAEVTVTPPVNVDRGLIADLRVFVVTIQGDGQPRNRGSISGRGVQTASGPHPATCRMDTGAISPGLKRLGPEADHSPSSSAPIMNTWSYTSTPHILHGLVLKLLKTEFLLNNICKYSPYLTGTHYISAKKPNRLMLFGETVAVYCENHTEHTDTLCGQNAEFTENTLRLRYKAQPVNAVWGNSRCLL